MIVGLCLSVSAQVAPEVQTLVPGHPVEREIAGRESHTYQISLAAGQFARVTVEQRLIDVVLVLTSPEGRQLPELNFTDAGEAELLSIDSAAAGVYSLTVRGIGGSKMRGSYRLQVVAQTPTDSTKSYVPAQTLMLDASQLAKEGPTGIVQAIEKLEQAMPAAQEAAQRQVRAELAVDYEAKTQEATRLRTRAERKLQDALEEIEGERRRMQKQIAKLEEQLKDLRGAAFRAQRTTGPASSEGA